MTAPFFVYPFFATCTHALLAFFGKMLETPLQKNFTNAQLSLIPLFSGAPTMPGKEVYLFLSAYPNR